MMNKGFKTAVSILTPLVVGFLSSLITRDAMFQFNMVAKPPLAPPGFLFPIVWTILYIMMGISSYLIFEHDDGGDRKISSTKGRCKKLYVVQLIFNFFWSIIFFRFSLYYVAFAWLVILWVMVLALIVESHKLNKMAAYLLIPYLLWMTFAAYLNIGIAVLN